MWVIYFKRRIKRNIYTSKGNLKKELISKDLKPKIVIDTLVVLVVASS